MKASWTSMNGTVARHKVTIQNSVVFLFSGMNKTNLNCEIYYLPQSQILRNETEFNFNKIDMRYMWMFFDAQLPTRLVQPYTAIAWSNEEKWVIKTQKDIEEYHIHIVRWKKLVYKVPTCIVCFMAFGKNIKEGRGSLHGQRIQVREESRTGETQRHDLGCETIHCDILISDARFGIF